MRPLNYILILLLFLSICVPCADIKAEDGKLVKIVALSRHGVRAPTQSDKTLKQWSQKAWPVWPVGRGELTPRGARLVTAMWENLKPTLVSYGLLPASGCPAPGSVFVRADVDERTKATARALLAGIAPDCSIGFAVEDGKVDPLFHPVKAGLYHFNPIPAAMDVLTMTGGGLDELQENYEGVLNLMEKITGPPGEDLCAKFTISPNCRLSDLPNAISISPGGENIRVVGSLGIASRLVEIFLLEYGEWPGVNAGWGQVNSTILSQLMPVHSKIFNVINRAPVVAWAKGSGLLREMTEALFDKHYDPRLNQAKLVVFVGHDTNIANIGGLLDITWQAVGYPENGIPPGSVLFLELWEKQGRQEVVVRFFAQPPVALHAPFADETTKAGKTENIHTHAPMSASVNAPPVVGRARFEAKSFIRKVENVTSGAPLPPKQIPPLDFSKNAPKPVKDSESEAKKTSEETTSPIYK